MVKINDMDQKELFALIIRAENYIRGSITDICKTNFADNVVETLSKLENLRSAIFRDNPEEVA